MSILTSPFSLYSSTNWNNNFHLNKEDQTVKTLINKFYPTASQTGSSQLIPPSVSGLSFYLLVNPDRTYFYIYKSDPSLFPTSHKAPMKQYFRAVEPEQNREVIFTTCYKEEADLQIQYREENIYPTYLSGGILTKSNDNNNYPFYISERFPKDLRAFQREQTPFAMKIKIVEKMLELASKAESIGMGYYDYKLEHFAIKTDENRSPEIRLLDASSTVFYGRGSFGYAPPDWFSHQYEPRFCNYAQWSLGICLLEILSGKNITEPTNTPFPKLTQSLSKENGVITGDESSSTLNQQDTFNACRILGNAIIIKNPGYPIPGLLDLIRHNLLQISFIDRKSFSETLQGFRTLFYQQSDYIFNLLKV